MNPPTTPGQEPTGPPPTAPPPPPQPYAPQPYAQPYAQPNAYPVENPGQTLGIIGLVLNFLGISIGGIILGVMSRNRSRAANMPTTLGTFSLVWGIIYAVLGFIGFILFMLLLIIGSLQ